MNDDWFEELKRKKIDAGIKEGEFVRDSYIHCPYCGFRQVDAWECVPRNQEDWTTYECEKCNSIFHLRYEIVYDTRIMGRRKGDIKELEDGSERNE
jgi:DNA-directed RNA polymerase subunit RPC12/RpoP